MASDGGPRAWAFLRRNRDYRRAWRAALEHTAFEAASFPVRIQSTADRHARAWGLLAWEDPHGADDHRSPFWAEAPMLEAEWRTKSTPLRVVLAHSGASLSGLRLGDGALILKIQNRGEAAQVRIRARFESGMEAGLVVPLGLEPGQAQAISRFKELGSVVHGPGRAARRHGDGELLTVLDGRLAGKSWRETAVDLYGEARVAAEWHPDSWIRTRVRRRGEKARILMEYGYRRLAAGR